MPTDLPLPIIRISQIVDLMRRFQRAVVRTNAPQSFDRRAKMSAERREHLRRHREASLAIAKPEFGVTPIYNFLRPINSDFIVGGGSHPIDDAVWEGENCPAVRRWADEGYSLLSHGLKDGSGPALIATATLQNWQRERESIEWSLLQQLWVITRQQSLETSDTELPKLNNRQYLTLQVLYEQEAFSPDDRLKSKEVVGIAEGPTVEPSKYKEAIAALKHMGFTDSMEGTKGGIWLTQRGKRIGRRLSQKK